VDRAVKYGVNDLRAGDLSALVGMTQTPAWWRAIAACNVELFKKFPSTARADSYIASVVWYHTVRFDTGEGA